MGVTPDQVEANNAVTLVRAGVEALAQLLNTLRLPHSEEGKGTAQGNDAGDNIGELVSKERCGQPLCQGKGNANHCGCRRSFLDAAEAVQDEGDEDIIGDGVAFAGVSQYPARVKCALLGYNRYLPSSADETN